MKIFTKREKLFILFLPLFFLLPLSVWASTIYLDPSDKTIGPDDTFEIKVKIGVTGGKECINTAKVGLSFSPDVLEFKDFSVGESIFPFWVEKPKKEDIEKINKEGRLFFSGGIPGGYCGKIPGDPGDSNILGTAVFSVKKPIIFYKTNIDVLAESEVYLNDGLGTKASLDVLGTSLEINKDKSQEDSWAQKLAEDIVPPEPFIIEINKTPKLFDNRYFLTFFTVDKQTGVDHYEVLEEDPIELLNASKKDNYIVKKIKDITKVKKPVVLWQIVVSPYLLEDQSLNKVIIVKAVDKAGNETIIEYQNSSLEKYKNPKKGYFYSASVVKDVFQKKYILVITAIILILLVSLIIIKKKLAKNKNIRDEKNLK